MTGFDFSGKVVLVTGGTKGIGAAIAQAFMDAGATVYVCGRTPPASVAADALAGSQTGSQTALPENAPRFIAADVRDIDAIDALLAQIERETGRLDVLVSNAGGAPFALAAQASPRFTEAVIRLNLLAPLQIAQRANTLMQQQPDGGVLLFIGSVSGLRASPGTAAYGAAKAGLLNAVRSLAVEWAPKVRVCAVSPSLVETEAATSGHTGSSPADGEAALDNITATIPAGRLAKPGDIASACLFLASPHAAYASGSNLILEGGGEVPAFLAATDLHKAFATTP
ncbi:Oxidoreductase UcpA [Paraburkholderia domus]|jgi:NAD(P)-dependent dehydrogenase (short-subunit alcohol dehydrogenase family)|uniref:SDR family oxidoreductase n=1 Tax=Paraburkholderia domus TaxID=2793075 RepID=UPI001912FAD6|nr:SDR family oxidoreductase [Paraburkholderia domus]MBK5048750.1 SDR family oxidoreductase [Burkholderia sp. R-70006]MBK5090474.1 SDR family oxidoreductase [Burkholderia sp. R-69927]CAE6728139.1 Oxidoreductase UcpA [Paraburkholderia domus]CAE6850083.1 Oxidoreductase UcpA [Paraburkholderia domus]CAE6919935.1 Oxidoreductase UcpA [Paraburkholderia domus]